MIGACSARCSATTPTRGSAFAVPVKVCERDAVRERLAGEGAEPLRKVVGEREAHLGLRQRATVGFRSSGNHGPLTIANVQLEL